MRRKENVLRKLESTKIVGSQLRRMVIGSVPADTDSFLATIDRLENLIEETLRLVELEQ